MTRVLQAILVALALLCAVGWWYWSRPVSPGETAPTPGAGVPVQLFYYSPERDQGEGGVQCSRLGLVSVGRVIPQTSTPIEDTLRLLLSGDITPAERTEGIESEFPLPGFSLLEVRVEGGVATLRFSDPQNKTVGGACRTGVLWHQIEATALQFPGVDSARFEPEDLFQP